MPKKSVKKKKAYKIKLRKAAKEGLWNNAAGDLRPMPTGQPCGMQLGFRGGYRL